MEGTDTRRYANAAQSEVFGTPTTDFFAMHAIVPSWLSLSGKTAGPDVMESLFEQITEVASRHDFAPEEIEQDIAEAVRSVRKSGR